MDVHAVLRAAAAAERVTRAELAEATGLTASRVSDLLRGYASPRPDELEKLAKALPLLKAMVEKVAR